MYRVTGGINGVVYDVAVLDEAPWIKGTVTVESHLEMRVGEPFLATPTGPTYILALDDGPSVLACLGITTVISEMDGDVPQLVPPGDPNAADG